MSMTSNLGYPADSQSQANNQGKPEPGMKIEKQTTTLNDHPLPEHWKPPSLPGPFIWLRLAIFKCLCICSYGSTSLDKVWFAIKLNGQGDESVWVNSQRQLSKQQNSLLVVAGLLVTTSAVLMTTTPPNASMVNYTLRGPYICLLSAFGLLLGGIIVSLICILVTNKIPADYTEKVLYANRLHVYCTLTIISYPFLSIGLATLLLAFSFLTAIWCAKDPGIQIIGGFVLALPLSMAFLFAISSAKPPPANDVIYLSHV